MGGVDQFVDVGLMLGGKNLFSDSPIEDFVGGGNGGNRVGLVAPTEAQGFEVTVFEEADNSDAIVDELKHTQRLSENKQGVNWLVTGFGGVMW